MQFEMEGAVPIDDPGPEQVEQGVRALRLPEQTFAILDARPGWYLQTAVDGDETFVLEFQDGSLDQHFRAARPLALDEVVVAFLSYLRQDGLWRSACDWERMHL